MVRPFIRAVSLPKSFGIFTIATTIAYLGMAVDARAGNDRYVIAQFTNGTSTAAGGVNTTLDLTVYNDINNLQYPSHFVQWVQVTIPSGFTGSGSGGAFTASDFIAPAGWHESSIAGNVITFMSASTDYTFTAGTSRTFLLKVNTPTATACPGTSYPFQVIANQSTSGGVGNTYPYRPKTALPTVSITNCIVPTYLVMNSVSPGSIFTTGVSQTVTLTATLTTLLHDNLGNPVAGTPLANEPVTFYEGSAAISCQGPAPVTNASGVASCTYTPLGGPITPLTAGNYDESAGFAGDQVPYPPYGGTNSSPKQLTVSATDTSLTVQDASGSYGGSVTLSATLAGGAAQTGLSSRTITFSLNGATVGSTSTDASGTATLNNVSIVGIAGGSYPGYIGATFAGDGTYGAVSNYAKLTVTQVGQTISFTGPGDQPLINGSVSIGASDSASLQVTFTSNSPATCSVGAGTLSGSTTTATVSFLALGPCTITASQSGNSSFGAAQSVQQSFNIVNTAMTCTLGNMSVPFTGNPQSPTCTTNLSGVACGVSNAPQTTSGSYLVSAVPPTGYSCSASGTFTINKLTPTLSWSNPSDIVYGTALSSTQLNATASVPGAFVYTPAAGTVLNAGSNQTLSVVFTPTDSVNYNSVPGSVQINVQSAPQTVNITSFVVGVTGTPNGGTISFGTTDATICTATAITVTGTTPATNLATQSTALVTLNASNPNATWAQCKVTATQNGNTNYLSSPAVTATLGTQP